MLFTIYFLLWFICEHYCKQLLALVIFNQNIITCSFFNTFFQNINKKFQTITCTSDEMIFLLLAKKLFLHCFRNCRFMQFWSIFIVYYTCLNSGTPSHSLLKFFLQWEICQTNKLSTRLNLKHFEYQRDSVLSI